MNILFNRLFPIELEKGIKNLKLWGWDLSNIEAKEVLYVKNFLESSEILRGKNYLHIENQFHFYISRFFAKKILSYYMDKPCNEIRFNYAKNGKPFIINYPTLNFNISHSENLGIIGVSFTTQLGVDIEYVKIEQDILGSANLFLNELEMRWVMEDDYYNRFYKIWTIKEAYLKYYGIGIADGKFPTVILSDNKFLNDVDIKFVSEKIDNYWYSICFLE